MPHAPGRPHLPRGAVVSRDVLGESPLWATLAVISAAGLYATLPTRFITGTETAGVYGAVRWIVPALTVLLLGPLARPVLGGEAADPAAQLRVPVAIAAGGVASRGRAVSAGVRRRGEPRSRLHHVHGLPDSRARAAAVRIVEPTLPPPPALREVEAAFDLGVKACPRQRRALLLPGTGR
jgi:hypothetical protein